MRLTFLSRRREPGSHRPTHTRQRTPLRRPPRLEALEDRLQPGEWLLGALLGGPLWGLGLLAEGAASWAPEDELAAARREAQPDQRAAGEPGGPALVLSVAPLGGQGAPDQGPRAAAWAGSTLTQPTSTSEADELFALARINRMPGGGSIGRGPASVGPEALAPPPAPGGAPTGAASAAGQAANGGPPTAAPPVAQGGGADLAALRHSAGLPAAPQAGPRGHDGGAPAGGAAAAGSSVSLRAHASAVHARFDLSSVAGSPFASDLWTVADATQNTGRRINLPYPPDCSESVSECQDIDVLNTLDGFNLQPRLSIPFDGDIDPHTVTSDTVFLIRLGDTLDPHDRGGQVVGINQVVWDVETQTLHVESDELLDQHTRYALIVTNGVKDLNGDPVQASEEFKRFRHDLNFGQAHDPALKEYRKGLLGALKAARGAGVAEKDVVTASVFTTMSATSVLEKIRDQIHAATPEAADFLLGPGGTRTVFSRNSIGNIITWNQQNRVVGLLNPVPVNLSPLDTFPGAVGQLAFGKYSSPDYQVHPDQVISPVGTRTGAPVVQGMNEIYFNLYLPSGTMPANGWPVAIFGHGINASKEGYRAQQQDTQLLSVVSSMAAHGVATLTINAVGHGFGPRSTLTVTTAEASLTFSAAGRGVDQNSDTRIGSSEGVSASGQQGIVGYSDGFRQTAADLMQLVQVIGVGMDVDGDGTYDLDPARIYYFGNSMGGGYGTVFTAVEPGVGARVLTVPEDPIPAGRLGLASRRALGTILASRQPSLLNAPGITVLGGLPVPSGPFFDENMPLRDQTPLTVQLADGTTRVIQSPVSNTVAGAMAIQEIIERYEWVGQAGSPAAYAPHLRKDPLPGVPAKPVLFQIAKGDERTPNPTTTAILRAGELTDQMVYYRHDLARAAIPSLQRNPHEFMVSPRDFGAIALGAQAQIATFFASDGTEIIQPPGLPEEFFEVPIEGPLPEGLNYLP